MSTRWIFTPQGQPAYYQTDGHIYTREGCYSYRISDGWWFRVPDGQASYYVSDNWIFTRNGKPAYYYGDND